MGSDTLFWYEDVHADKTSICVSKSLKKEALVIALVLWGESGHEPSQQ